MHLSFPADDHIHISADLARLRQREMALRAAFARTPEPGTPERSTRVEVTVARTRVFDPTLLPAEIRENPRYWRDRVTQTIRCLPVQGLACRPGWPIRRTAEAGSMH